MTIRHSNILHILWNYQREIVSAGKRGSLEKICFGMNATINEKVTKKFPFMPNKLSIHKHTTHPINVYNFSQYHIIFKSFLWLTINDRQLWHIDLLKLVINFNALWFTSYHCQLHFMIQITTQQGKISFIT